MFGTYCGPNKAHISICAQALTQHTCKGHLFMQNHHQPNGGFGDYLLIKSEAIG